MVELLNLPPFPELFYQSYLWNGSVTLKTWAGFRARPDFWNPIQMSEVSDGFSHLFISPIDYEKALPSPEQSTAFQYLIEHEKAIHDSVLQAILDEYPSRRTAYGYDLEEDGEDEDCDAMPDIDHPDQLKMLIGLKSVAVLRTAKQDVAYLRLDFAAAWDPEHGFNVTTHKDRVVRVGDTGAGEYHAQDDAQKT